MDKFCERFEDHKIPEWYSKYMDYQKLCKIWEKVHAEDSKIDGFYICSKEYPYHLSKFEPAEEKDKTLSAFQLKLQKGMKNLIMP